MHIKSIALAGALALVACHGPTSKSAGKSPPARAAIKPLPGTEAVQSLLTGVGKSAAPSSGTAVALGGLFGQGGVLGGGPRLGAGVTGAAQPTAAPPISPARGGATATKPVDPDTGYRAPGDDADTAYGAPGDDGTDSDLDPANAATPPPQVPVTLPPPMAAGGDCHAVATRVGDLARATMDAQLASIDAEARRAAESMVEDTLAQIPAMIEAACTTQRWPQDLEDCVLTAATIDALQTCDRFATPAMRAQAEAAAANQAPALAQPTTPAPAWDGAATDCAATARQAVAMAEWQMSAAPADLRGTTADLLPQLQAGVEQACTTAAWTEPQRRCVLTATSIEAMNACGL